LDNNFYDRECIILKIVYKNIGTIIFWNVFSHKYTKTSKTQHENNTWLYNNQKMETIQASQ
jgi:hypothetical protein